MDLTPFSYINPCGYEGLASVQMKQLNPTANIQDVKKRLLDHLNRQLFQLNPTL
jgi:lipoyl(octanoyl) transferase